MEIITVAVQKGGTGKSTTAVVLAQAAAYRGRKVLVVDCDPQANASLMLGADVSGEIGSTYNLISGLPAAQTIQATEQGIDVIAGSWDLATITTSTGSARRLQQALKPISGEYDIIIIDTPPTAGELQYNAIQAATGLIIPLQADVFSLQALYQIADTAAQIQQTNKQLQIKGIILTQHNDRSTIARQMQQAITEKAAELGIPYLGAIRAAVAVREATALQASIYQYAPTSKPAQDYLTIFDSLTAV